ncbi:MAG: hypothetical protein A2W91_11050 [Bacteroidetes bacterium GWF2_38_335]|nr:MAG: hypothetical protein A2W91_11050 [Bacteroidetes bacterium GWF2_38_335]OFY81763.1 MAG: hypothetical protein A2281_05990 [Bacteroidetes bacterium RIFOXYA12_FULL_38_20]HBS87831.1 hypothetical protein [Bacteroidales bacterium]
MYGIRHLLAPLQGSMELVKIHISHRALPCANAKALSGQLLPETNALCALKFRFNQRPNGA